MTIDPLTLQLIGTTMKGALEMWAAFEANPEITPAQLEQIRAVNKAKEDAALKYIRQRRAKEERDAKG